MIDSEFSLDTTTGRGIRPASLCKAASIEDMGANGYSMTDGVPIKLRRDLNF